MPDAKWLVIEESGASYFLYRYTGSGEFAGDTWHVALEDAHHQAKYEYGSQAGDWVEVPPSVDDAVQFAREHFDLGPSK